MLFHKDLNILHIPKGIRIISWATAVRFIGWGFVEMFIPIFILSFVDTYAEAGMLRSVYDIVFLAVLPIVSRMADRTSSRKIILSGLALYPLIALCYFFAGFFGAVIFIVIARFINGISYALDSVGKKTYMRRYGHDRIGVIFGYFDTLSYFWWLVAAAVGLIFVTNVPIHYLFLLIIPTTAIAAFLIYHIPREPEGRKSKFKGVFPEIYTDYRLLFSFVKKWNLEQKYAAVLYAFLSVITVILYFFLPIVSFIGNQSYSQVFLLTSFAILPFVFGVPLGILADKSNPWILRRVIFSAICLFALLPFLHSLALTLAVIFSIGLCVYYSMLCLDRGATIHESRMRMGSLSAAFLSVTQISQIFAPMTVGFLIDRFSLLFAILLICIVGLFLIMPLYLFKINIFEQRP